MSNLLYVIFYLSLMTIRCTISDPDQVGQDNFLKTCPPTTCGNGSESLPIRFPLRLQSAPTNCSLKGLTFICSGNGTTLFSYPPFPEMKVTNIDYASRTLTIQLPEFDSAPCPLQNLTSLVKTIVDQTSSTYQIQIFMISFIRCSSKINSEDLYFVGPLPDCPIELGYFVYILSSYTPMGMLPLGCDVFWTGGGVPQLDYNNGDSQLAQRVDNLNRSREIKLVWSIGDGNLDFQCSICESKGMNCGFNWVKNLTFCFRQDHHAAGPNVKLIAGTSIGGFLILLLVSVSIALFCVFRISKKEKETRLKVERFLATYKTTKPTRYSYSEIKKITKRFRHKLGQGGFGSVYKGKLLNGFPVAVKMLERSKGEGEEFINEVATIGRIHHVNIVRLLGFCSEGARHALVYEFMPNGSLDNFIFSREGEGCYQQFDVEKMLETALGIAQGIEYLHQGCDERILHFDIKPHNILLDHNFIPKVSDFGLAKLCSRDHSVITMTAARGTMGYIAPEMYSRNFGEVSYKSDVYSYGMLLLEMISGRRTIEPTVDNESDFYFPEWIYNRIISGEDLGLALTSVRDEEIVKKLAIVSLWCTQWSPSDRPTMTRVIQLLMGSTESLQIPPKPFVSSYQDNILL